jgi:hypothetical protein
MEFGIQLDSLVFTYMFDHTYTQFRLVQISNYTGHSGKKLSFNSGRGCTAISKKFSAKKKWGYSSFPGASTCFEATVSQISLF